MTTKTGTAELNDNQAASLKDGRRLFTAMHVLAWIIFAVGMVLCLSNIREFHDRNWSLMIGTGFLIGSVHIYVIGTAMQLVHQRRLKEEDAQQ